MATTLQNRNHNVLGEAERRQLAECETAIQTAQCHKLAEAQALKTIRENRLYRATYKTFEIYCQTRWGYSRQHAQQLIDWAVVNDDLSTVVCTPDQLPQCERHARPLVSLSPIQRQKAWASYLETNPKKHVAAAIAAIADQVIRQPVNAGHNIIIKIDITEDAGEAPSGIRTPLRWFGAKTMLARKIVGTFPEHKSYIEIFAGSAAVLFAKPPSHHELINDLDGDVWNFFKMLRERHEELQQLLKKTPYSREEHQFCKGNPEPSDPVERARRFFVRCRQSYNGLLDGHFAASSTKDAAGSCKAVVDGLEAVAERLRAVQVENTDWRNVLKLMPDQQDTLLYADPPYLADTITRHGVPYRHHLSDADHVELLERLRAYRHARIAISGYDSPLYNSGLAGWKRYEFQRRITVSAVDEERTTSNRIEVLWANW